MPSTDMPEDAGEDVSARSRPNQEVTQHASAQGLVNRFIDDINAWHHRALTSGEGAPDFWDELNTSERLAEWLVAAGYSRPAAPTAHEELIEALTEIVSASDALAAADGIASHGEAIRLFDTAVERARALLTRLAEKGE